jgi:hypothetical protein
MKPSSKQWKERFKMGLAEGKDGRGIDQNKQIKNKMKKKRKKERLGRPRVKPRPYAQVKSDRGDANAEVGARKRRSRKGDGMLEFKESE